MRPGIALTLLVLATGWQSAFAQSAQCPVNRPIVYIQRGVNDNPAAVIAAVGTPNVVVLLAPDVDIDFSQVTSPIGPEDPLIVLKRCVTLASYQPTTPLPLAVSPGGGGGQPVPGSGRTPHSLGPVLRYCTNPKTNCISRQRSSGAAFIQASCTGDPTDPNFGDGAKILGFRLFGPNFADHHTSEKGISLRGCPDAEIGNMEVAGWGEAAVFVDNPNVKGIPTQAPNPVLVSIHDSYIHNNQNSEHDGSSLGYGVEVGAAGFANIYQNLFDYNKHSITASGFAGGYNAVYNLILKGGGYQNSVKERNIHVVDVHGTANCPNISQGTGIVAGAAAGVGAGVLIGGAIGGPIGAGIGGLIGGILGGIGGSTVSQLTQHLFNCGNAGLQFFIDQNTIQYDKTTDLKIRGEPKQQAFISGNIFARSSRNDAIQLETTKNVSIDATNKYNDDTFGKYGVCDIDGDGVDDLILMTGVSWWFSSGGQYPWSFLRADTTVLKDVALGEIDGDQSCDAIKDAGNGMWMVSRGATADWQPLGNFGVPLSQTHLGRFDPAQTDYGRGIKPITHAFWRRSDGQWLVTLLSQPGAWIAVASSSAPLTSLRFGDFIGDGVTDVLANIAGHWAFSYAASSPWENLNPTLNDPVGKPNVFIANLDADDNLDDVLRLDTGAQGYTTRTATWRRSLHGRTPWSQWKTYAFAFDESNPEDDVSLGAAFTGRFGPTPGDATLTIDPVRIGHFFSPAQGKDNQEWLSLFAY